MLLHNEQRQYVHRKGLIMLQNLFTKNSRTYNGKVQEIICCYTYTCKKDRSMWYNASQLIRWIYHLKAMICRQIWGYFCCVFFLGEFRNTLVQRPVDQKKGRQCTYVVIIFGQVTIKFMMQQNSKVVSLECLDVGVPP